MEWKENSSMENGIVKVWNEMEDFINGIEKNFPYFHAFSKLTHFNVIFIPNAVNNAAFNQTHKND